MQNISNHRHTWKEDSTYNVCECGKKILKLITTNKQDIKVGQKILNNKLINYSVRDNRKRFFYPEEWTKFFDALETAAQKRTFNILINTGARINEASHIKVEDVDFNNNRLILRVTKVKAKKGQKNPEPRTIPISTEFKKYLKTLKNEMQLNNNDTFKMITTSAANIALKGKSNTNGGMLKKAGIKDWHMFSVHNIRKTFECWMIALGVDTLPLIAHMGHDVKTASQSYVNPNAFTYKEKDMMRTIVGDIYS